MTRSTQRPRMFRLRQIGIACYPADGTDIQTLTANADAAMYLVKDEGTQRISVFSPAAPGTSPSSGSRSNHLRLALERDELLLNYQPQIDLATSESPAWRRSYAGALRSGLAPACVHSACRRNGADPADRRLGDPGSLRAEHDVATGGDAPVSMAVNLSARQFIGDRLL